MADEQQNENQEFEENLEENEQDNELRNNYEDEEDEEEQEKDPAEEEEEDEEEEKSSEPDVGKSLFTIGQQVSYKGKACTVINEYERSLCIEYNYFPFPDESEEDFPYRREIIRKGEAEAPVE
ncbi:hypothetical protein [Salibacterium sp. K-3]